MVRVRRLKYSAGQWCRNSVLAANASQVSAQKASEQQRVTPVPGGVPVCAAPIRAPSICGPRAHIASGGVWEWVESTEPLVVF